MHAGGRWHDVDPCHCQDVSHSRSRPPRLDNNSSKIVNSAYVHLGYLNDKRLYPASAVESRVL